jgi:hypothetical protein
MLVCPSKKSVSTPTSVIESVNRFLIKENPRYGLVKGYLLDFSLIIDPATWSNMGFS